MKPTRFILAILLVSYVLYGCSLTYSPVFNEKHRPQFHFSPPSQWTNDPNGLVFYKDEYHLFYQHYPDSNIWGPMHWGHAVSKDLVKWEHLPVALYPDSLGWIFSGSAVIDINNSSGFGTTKNPPMVAIFSYHSDTLQKQRRRDFQTQGIAYSLDRGRTWSKYAGNPVLRNPGFVNFRDPKVFWHEDSNKWIMILTLGDRVNIYSSKDLKSWNLESSFGEGIGAHNGTWECPDLLPLKDANGNEKWVMIISIIPGGPNGGTGTQYFVGDFNGAVFTSADSITRWLDYGRDNYAGITFNNIPASDGRRIFIGWMSNWDYATLVPTTIWRNSMTLPRSLELFKRGDRYFVKSNILNELDIIKGKSYKINTEGKVTLQDSLYHIHLKFEDIKNGFKLRLSNESDENVSIGYSDGEFSFDRTKSGLSDFHPEFAGLHTAPFYGDSGNMYLDIYVDLSSIEVFINGGELVFTELVFPSMPYRIFEAVLGKEHIREATVQKLNSIWSNK